MSTEYAKGTHGRLATKQLVQVDAELLKDFGHLDGDLLESLRAGLESLLSIRGRGVTPTGMRVLRTCHAELRRRGLKRGR